MQHAVLNLALHTASTPILLEPVERFTHDDGWLVGTAAAGNFCTCAELLEVHCVHVRWGNAFDQYMSGQKRGVHWRSLGLESAELSL